MTRRDIKRAVLRGLAAEMDSATMEWVYDVVETPDDESRLENVLKELADEFSRRGREFDTG